MRLLCPGQVETGVKDFTVEGTNTFLAITVTRRMELDGDHLELHELDRRSHRRLLNVAAHAVPAAEDLSIADLAFVLHDVLVDGLRSGTDLRGRHDAYRARVGEAAGEELAPGALDTELFLLGAYATVVGLDVALVEPERAAVLGEFAGQGGGLLRFRRRVPSRWRTGRAVSRYRAAEPEGGGSFVHVAAVFVADVTASRRAPELSPMVEAVLERIALEAFYDAAVGTVNAARGWRLAP